MQIRMWHFWRISDLRKKRKISWVHQPRQPPMVLLSLFPVHTCLSGVSCKHTCNFHLLHFTRKVMFSGLFAASTGRDDLEAFAYLLVDLCCSRAALPWSSGTSAPAMEALKKQWLSIGKGSTGPDAAKLIKYVQEHAVHISKPHLSTLCDFIKYVLLQLMLPHDITWHFFTFICLRLQAGIDTTTQG
jgi:hypothetical protein